MNPRQRAPWQIVKAAAKRTLLLHAEADGSDLKPIPIDATGTGVNLLAEMKLRRSKDGKLLRENRRSSDVEPEIRKRHSNGKARNN